MKNRINEKDTLGGVNMEFTNKMLPCFFTLCTLEPQEYIEYLIHKLKNADPNLSYTDAFSFYNILIRNEWFPDTYRNSTDLFTKELFNKTHRYGVKCTYYDMAKKTNSCKICLYNPYGNRAVALKDGKTIFLSLFLNKDNWLRFKEAEIKLNALSYWYYYFDMKTKKFIVRDLVAPIYTYLELSNEDAWKGYNNLDDLYNKMIISNKVKKTSDESREHALNYLKEQKEIALKRHTEIQREFDKLIKQNTSATQISIPDLKKLPQEDSNARSLLETDKQQKEAMAKEKHGGPEQEDKQRISENPEETSVDALSVKKIDTEVKKRDSSQSDKKEFKNTIKQINSVEEFQTLIWNKNGLNETRIFLDACGGKLFCCKLSGEKYLVDITDRYLKREVRELLSDKKTRKIMRSVINLSGLLGSMVHDILNSEDISILEQTALRSPGMFELLKIIKGKYTEDLDENALSRYCENIYSTVNQLEQRYLKIYWKENMKKGPITNLEKIEHYRQYYNSAALFSFNPTRNNAMDYRFKGTFSFCKELDTQENRIKIISNFLIMIGKVKKAYKELIKFYSVDLNTIEYYANDSRFIGDHKDMFWRGMAYAIWNVVGKESKPDIKINGERLHE